MVVIVAGQFGVAHRLMESGATGNVVPLHAAHVVGIENNVMYRVLYVEDGRLPQADAAAHLHVLQLRGPAGQRLVQHAGMDGAESVVHPVAGFDDLYRFISCGQLLAVQLLIICKRHGKAPLFLFLPIVNFTTNRIDVHWRMYQLSPLSIVQKLTHDAVRV